MEQLVSQFKNSPHLVSALNPSISLTVRRRTSSAKLPNAYLENSDNEKIQLIRVQQPHGDLSRPGKLRKLKSSGLAVGYNDDDDDGNNEGYLPGQPSAPFSFINDLPMTTIA